MNKKANATVPLPYDARRQAEELAELYKEYSEPLFRKMRRGEYRNLVERLEYFIEYINYGKEELGRRAWRYRNFKKSWENILNDKLSEKPTHYEYLAMGIIALLDAEMNKTEEEK